MGWFCHGTATVPTRLRAVLFKHILPAVCGVTSPSSSKETKAQRDHGNHPRPHQPFSWFQPRQLCIKPMSEMCWHLGVYPKE